MGDEAWASRRSSPSPRPHSPKYAHPPTCPLQTEALEAEELKAHLAVEAALNAEEEAWMEEAESETEKETEDNRKRYEIEVEIEVRELERQAQYKAKRLLEAHYEADGQTRFRNGQSRLPGPLICPANPYTKDCIPY